MSGINICCRGWDRTSTRRFGMRQKRLQSGGLPLISSTYFFFRTPETGGRVCQGVRHFTTLQCGHVAPQNRGYVGFPEFNQRLCCLPPVKPHTEVQHLSGDSQKCVVHKSLHFFKRKAINMRHFSFVAPPRLELGITA